MNKHHWLLLALVVLAVLAFTGKTPYGDIAIAAGV